MKTGLTLMSNKLPTYNDNSNLDYMYVIMVRNCRWPVRFLRCLY